MAAQVPFEHIRVLPGVANKRPTRGEVEATRTMCVGCDQSGGVAHVTVLRILQRSDRVWEYSVSEVAGPAMATARTP